ncbi:MAG: protein kinase [Myxococcales bacterium]|nr:protein kinase [Myxococcales bacterium]
MPSSPAIAFELSCRYIDTLMNVATEECDRGEFMQFLGEWQIDLEYLRNQSNWVSQRFCEALTKWVVERVGLAHVAERTTEAALSEKSLGFLVPLLRAFGSPRTTYQYTPRVAALLSKVSRIKVLEIRRGFGVLEFRQSDERVREASPYLCHLRRAYLASIPTLWRLPPAIINETECQQRGGTRCCYHLHWVEKLSWWPYPTGAAAGALGAMLMSAPLSGRFLGAGAGAAAVAGWQALGTWRQARDIRKRYLAELDEVAKAAETRFLEHTSEELQVSQPTTKPQGRPVGAGVARLETAAPRLALVGEARAHTEAEERNFEARPGDLPSPGTVLAERYEVEGLLARGGMAYVFRALDKQTAQPVALKLLRPELALERQWIARLGREFRLARQILHPNVCQVLDFRHTEGGTFLTMQLAGGGTLRGQMQIDTQRPDEDRIADARAVIAGLAAIHTAGIVHRDVTPRNILRMTDGRLAVADFGLAMDPDETMTFIGGTPGYMAPEVVMGQKPTFQSDVWQLGLVVHEILYGERPRWERSEGHAGRYVVFAHSDNPAIQEMTDVCAACLQDDPIARPPSANAVWQQIVMAQQARIPGWFSRAYGNLSSMLPTGGRRTPTHLRAQPNRAEPPDAAPPTLPSP